MQKNKGFTLIELMITIAVLAIIATMAAPSFSQMLNKRKLETELKDLTHVLSLARSQAVLLRTNTIVNLNSTSNNTQTNFSWSPKTNGIVLVDVPDGYNSPPDIVFNAQGMFIARNFVRMKKETNVEGVEEWVVDKVLVDGVMVNQLENYPRTITICSEKLKKSKTIKYSVIGSFESVQEGDC